MNVQIQPAQLLESILERRSRSGSLLCIYWLMVTSDRSRYADAFRSLASGKLVSVSVVRDTGFSNPNSIAADVIAILNNIREEVEETFRQATTSGSYALLLLGKSELPVAQSSSPVTLPEWFPVAAGQISDLLVEDLTWLADGPINCSEAKIDEMCELLYDLEGALLRRLHDSHAANHNNSNAFMELIRNAQDESYAELLKTFRRSHDDVRSATGFRPSRRASSSLISRIWEISQKRTPEDLLKPGRALSDALGLTPDLIIPPESLAAILNRPSNRDTSNAQKFARGLMVTIGVACQFITAAAHADSYPRYPVPLLISFSYDLRASLSSALATLIREQ